MLKLPKLSVLSELRAIFAIGILQSSRPLLGQCSGRALRQDPEVILVGELRDLETIEMAVSAAETGHLVFGTLHTTAAPKTFDRIIDVFPGEEKDMVRSMLSVSLRAVISQTLEKSSQLKAMFFQAKLTQRLLFI